MGQWSDSSIRQLYIFGGKQNQTIFFNGYINIETTPKLTSYDVAVMEWGV